MRSVSQSRYRRPPAGVPDVQAPLWRWLSRGLGTARAACSCGRCEAPGIVVCAHVDRHDHPCGARLCRRHSQTWNRRAYCPAHIVSVVPEDFGEHRIATALQWLSLALDSDIIDLLRPIAAAVDESVVSDPTRFVAVGLRRTRTWERVWKTASDLGVGCRVALVIEDRLPDQVQVQVNSHTVVTLPTPFGLCEEVDPLVVADKLAAAVTRPLQVALEVWLQNALVQLRGARLPSA